MTRRSVTTVTFRVKMRLPPGVKANEAKDFLDIAIQCHRDSFAKTQPIAALDINEVIITIGERKTVYL